MNIHIKPAYYFTKDRTGTHPDMHVCMHTHTHIQALCAYIILATL